jgi:periplasmic mercuric ion binding protein
MRKLGRWGLMTSAVTLVLAASLWAAEQKVTLMLGGQSCDLYMGAVQDALKKVAGVKAVDTKSMKGHAIVSGDGSMKPAQLTAAVNGLKGDGWQCQAEVMK